MLLDSRFDFSLSACIFMAVTVTNYVGVVSDVAERVTDNDNIVIAPTEGAALTDAAEPTDVAEPTGVAEPTDAAKPTDAAEPTDTADADSDEVSDFSQLSKKRSEEGSGLDWMQQLMSQINKAADEKGNMDITCSDSVLLKQFCLKI